MPLNKLVKNFIEEMKQGMLKNPPKPFSAMSIEYREMVTPFKDLMEEVPPITQQDFFVTTSTHKIPIRIYIPEEQTESPALIFFHGGGFIANLQCHQAACARIAKLTHCKVIDVDYRLAPEHRFPAAIDDGWEVLQWINQNAEKLQIDKNKFAIGGYSSGVNISTLIAIRARNEGYSNLIKHQVLVSPPVDFSRSLKSYESFEEYDELFTNEPINYVLSHYLPKGISSKDPNVSPYWNKNLTNLPATTLIVAEYDRLRSDTEEYYKKLQAANVKVKKYICDGQTHNYFIVRKILNVQPDPVMFVAQALNEAFHSKL